MSEALDSPSSSSSVPKGTAGWLSSNPSCRRVSPQLAHGVAKTSLPIEAAVEAGQQVPRFA